MWRAHNRIPISKRNAPQGGHICQAETVEGGNVGQPAMQFVLLVLCADIDDRSNLLG
jgi:hypothetical protein